jgi:hypothetical protein
MADPREQFDPYHKWLDIRPEDQPPTLYQLLGVAPFESDAQVIINASDQRMALLKGFAMGRWSEPSQRLLNEVARARVMLLDERRRREYDARLRRRLLPGAESTGRQPAIAGNELPLPAHLVRRGGAVLPDADRAVARGMSLQIETETTPGLTRCNTDGPKSR